MQRGAPRLRGEADQPGVGGRPREGRPRAPPARHRPGRGPPPPLPRPESLDRAGRGEDLEDPRVGRAGELPLSSRLRAARPHAGPERHRGADGAAGELPGGAGRGRQDRDPLPAGDRGALPGPPGTDRRVPRGADPREAAGRALGEGRARPARAARRERRSARAPPGPPRGVLPGAREEPRSCRPPDAGVVPDPVRRYRGDRPGLRRDVGHGGAEWQDRDRRRLHAGRRRAVRGGAAAGRARPADRRAGAARDVSRRGRAGRLPRRLRSGARGGHRAVRARRRRDDAGNPGGRAGRGRAPRGEVPRSRGGEAPGAGGRPVGPGDPARAPRDQRESPHGDAAPDRSRFSPPSAASSRRRA